LRAILGSAQDGALKFLESDEDVHMAVERVLTERIGAAGAKLHTGRSRNDQVVTDVRLYVKKALSRVLDGVVGLQHSLIRRAEVDDRAIIMPGYTHLQQAQPVLLAHYWLSFFFALEREKDRLRHAIESADSMPLGAGALAGSGVAVDRKKLAETLGFAKAAENSIDAVASRDFVLDALSCCASAGILCSRYAEDLIIWSSKEFGFVELDDAWSTGSSMMPQKKNPDSLELIRGKAGRFIGNYTRFAATLKGVGLTYYKDLQEDKEPLMDSLAQLDCVLAVFAQVVKTLAVNSKKIASTLDSSLFATDLADYLVRKGLPFRKAHEVIGNIVKTCLQQKKQLSELSARDLGRFSTLFDESVKRVFDWGEALRHRGVSGGTSPASVGWQIAMAKKMVAKKR
jgi:argininosuccinate lyase